MIKNHATLRAGKLAATVRVMALARAGQRVVGMDVKAAEAKAEATGVVEAVALIAVNAQAEANAHR